MFVVYKKIKTPESSPVLGPMNISPILASKEAPVNANESKSIASNDAATEADDAMEPFSLYKCCCSSRVNHKSKKDSPPHGGENSAVEANATFTSEYKYEFGHATHYIYNATTPRLICEFETGTPPSP